MGFVARHKGRDRRQMPDLALIGLSRLNQTFDPQMPLVANKTKREGGSSTSARRYLRPVRHEMLGDSDRVRNDRQGRVHAAVGRMQGGVADHHSAAAPEPSITVGGAGGRVVTHSCRAAGVLAGRRGGCAAELTADVLCASGAQPASSVSGQAGLDPE